MPSSPRHLGRLAIAGLPLVLAATLLPGAQSPTAGSARASAPATAPSLLTAAPSVSAKPVAPPVSGRHRLVGLQTDLIPRNPTGQEVSLPLFDDASFTGIFQHRFSGSHYTSWSGRLTTALGSFVVARSGSTYRIDISAPSGNYEVTRAAGGAYWVSQTDQRVPTGSDEVSVPADAPGLRPAAPVRRTTTAPADAAGAAGTQSRTRRHDSPRSIGVLFLFTPAALAEAGSVDNMYATIGAVAAQTNQAFVNSQIPTQMRVVGAALSNGPEVGGNLATDLARVRKSKDGYFRNAQHLRNTTHADLVHLIVGGTASQVCGLGYLKLPKFNYSKYAYSTSFYSCAPYYTISHELGHNLGADHDLYPGVTNYSKLSYSHGLVNTAAQWRTLMAYPNACYDAGIQNGCARLLYYSNPNLTYNGNPLGQPTRAFNAKAIHKFLPAIAKYRLGSIYHARLKIKGKSRVGHRIRVRHGSWTPRHKVHYTYQWTLDGSGIPRATHRRLRIKGSYFGHKVGVIVTGHAKHYTPVTSGKTLDRKIRKAHMNPARLSLKGKHHVGAKLTLKLRLKHWAPRPSRVKVSWYRGHHRIKGAHGIHYRLRKHDKHARVYARVRYRHHGYFQVVRRTSKVFVHGR